GRRHRARPSRRMMRFVRIEQMHPEEKRLGRLRIALAVPVEYAIDRVRSRTFADHEQLRLILAPQIVVVDVEALVEAIAAVEHDRRYISASFVARRLEPLR